MTFIKVCANRTVSARLNSTGGCQSFLTTWRLASPLQTCRFIAWIQAKNCQKLKKQSCRKCCKLAKNDFGRFVNDLVTGYILWNFTPGITGLGLKHITYLFHFARLRSGILKRAMSVCASTRGQSFHLEGIIRSFIWNWKPSLPMTQGWCPFFGI